MTRSVSAPTTPHTLLELAETALVEGRPEATLELTRQVLSEHPDHTDAMFLEAEALRDLRDGHASERRYRDVLGAQPMHHEAWSGLGALLFDQCRFDEAATCFGRALRARPDHADAFYGRAMIRERRGDTLGARRDYLRAWRLSSRYPMPRQLDDADVHALLAEAAQDAPEVAAWLEGLPVLVLDVPDADVCDAYDPPMSPGDLLGHVPLPYEGDLVPHGAWAAAATPVLLFRRNLERFADDHDQTVDALRETVVSQLALWLGQTASDA